MYCDGSITSMISHYLAGK